MSQPLSPPLPRAQTLPAGFRELCYWRISERPLRVVAINLLAFDLLPPAWLFFGALAVLSGKVPASLSFGTRAMLLTLAAIIVTVIVHELAHGALMRFYGARPTFGAIPSRLVVYATAPGHAFRRSQYVAIALAPLAVISLIALMLINLLPGSTLLIPVVICAALNVAGAAGDLWMTALVLRYPPDVYCIDEKDGVRVCSPQVLSPA